MKYNRDKMGEEGFKEMTIQEVIDLLNSKYTEKQRKTRKLYIASDEELNQIFKEFYISEDRRFIIFAGLSGTELDTSQL